ncbi:MAG: integrase arm-type DNA-binding domain-containing protein [Xanthobacteraceae bacterium]
MPTLPLTDTMIRAAKADQNKRLEITDAKCQGLELRVTGTGAKSFAFQYRSRRGDNKVVRLTLGSYPDLSLASARTIADQHRKAIADGRDPRDEHKAAVAKSAAKAEGKGRTFDQVADLYLENYAKPRKSSWRNDKSLLRRARFKWGKLPIGTITDDDVAKLLDDIAAEAPVSANRIQSVLHKVFGWAKEPGRKYVTANPVADMPRRTKEKPKERCLDEAEIRTLWRGLDDPKLPAERSVALALKLILITAARPGMVAGMTREELRGLDGKTPEWHLAGSRMKNRKAFIVPLCKEAVAIIKQAMPVKNQTVVFPSRFHHRASIARHTLSQSLLDIIRYLRMKKFTPHDLRRTAATLARSNGVPRDHVKALLAHIEADVTAIYDQYDMLDEKRAAANALGRAIGRIVTKPARTGLAARPGRKTNGWSRAAL